MSIFLGAAAGIFMALGEGRLDLTLIGIGLLMWANFYDSADGPQLAAQGFIPLALNPEGGWAEFNE